ncbi:unnamed protein product, partial [Symbiodinium sp. CCMP2592]
CNVQLSRSRLDRGLTRCAQHGRGLRAGNPAQRRVRSGLICLRPNCHRRLSQPRIRGGACRCAEHGGPWPAGRPVTALSRLRAATDAQLERSARTLAERSCMGSRLLLQMLRQHQGHPNTPQGVIGELESPLESPEMSAMQVGESAELLLLNAALARRLSPTAAVQLGWQSSWQPHVVCRKLLDLAATGAGVLSSSHYVAVFNQAQAAGHQRADLRRLLQRQVLGPVEAAWAQRATLLALAQRPVWRPLLEALAELPGHGPYWAGKLAWDLRALNVATPFPRDRKRFALWGTTGATRGLNLLLGRPRNAFLEPACCRAWGRLLLRFMEKVCPQTILGEHPTHELHCIAWWCCELSKTASDVWAPAG